MTLPKFSPLPDSPQHFQPLAFSGPVSLLVSNLALISHNWLMSCPCFNDLLCCHLDRYTWVKGFASRGYCGEGLKTFKGIRPCGNPQVIGDVLFHSALEGCLSLPYFPAMR